jgi:hypothetical protein
LNRLSDHKMGESYGARVGKAKSAEAFRKSERVRESRERESAESSENSVRILAPVVRVLGCLTVRASQNSIFIGSFFLCCNLLLRCHSLLRCHLFLRRHQFLRRYPCFRVHTHKQKHVCVVRECVVEQQAEKEGQVGSRK